MSDSPAFIRFHQLYPETPLPRRADATLSGTAPVRAVQHCEPFTAGSAFGWYVPSPLDFSLLWDGEIVYWKQALHEDWQELAEPVLLPGFAATWNAAAPEELQAIGAPPFLGRGPDAGIVQLWSGLVIETPPGWCTQVRPLANHPRDPRFEFLDGILETDWWRGAVITPMRLRKTDEAIRFRRGAPLYQVQLVARTALEASEADRSESVADWAALTPRFLSDFGAALQLHAGPGGSPGGYKREARRRGRKKEGGSSDES